MEPNDFQKKDRSNLYTNNSLNNFFKNENSTVQLLSNAAIIKSYDKLHDMPTDTLMCKETNEFICGWGAAFINICITFPINKIMFRQMAYGVKASNAVKQFKGESLFYIYRGLLPPLISKTVSVSLMFGTYHEFRKILHHNAQIQNSNVNHVLSAILAGCAEAALAPFERIQMLLQHKTFDSKFLNTYDAFYHLRMYGLKEYYRGMVPILLRNGPSNVIYFTSRDFVKKNFTESSYWYINLTQDFISGALIGAMTSTLFYPLNVIRTKMQITELGKKHITMREAFYQVYLERGKSLAKMYYGVHINFSRALLSWGIITASYEFLKKKLTF